MAEISRSDMVAQLQAVLREAFEGAAQWSYFTDHGPEAGLFGTLATLSAADVSQSILGSAIVVHVHHVTFGLEASAAWISGDRGKRDWNESWSVRTVDDAGWSRERGEMKRRYEELQQAIAAHATAGDEAFGGAVGAIAHVAYHLGAIKQKVAVLRKT